MKNIFTRFQNDTKHTINKQLNKQEGYFMSTIFGVLFYHIIIIFQQFETSRSE